MKKINVVFCMGALFLANVLAAESITYNKAEQWGIPGEIKEIDGCLSVSKRTKFISEAFTIDPAKKYTLKFSACAKNIQGGNDSWILCGYEVFDKKGRMITSESIRIEPGTDTVLTADAKAGSKTIYVKNGAKFKAASHHTIVWGTKPNHSDLPNFNVLARGIQKVEKAGEVWKITLKDAVLCDVKAGIGVRDQVQGGALYTGNIRVKDQWVSQNCVTKNFSHKGTFIGSGWPAGAYKAQIIFLVNWNNRKLDTLLKNITLDIE